LQIGSPTEIHGGDRFNHTRYFIINQWINVFLLRYNLTLLDSRVMNPNPNENE